jgi:hypothetical protein
MHIAFDGTHLCTSLGVLSTQVRVVASLPCYSSKNVNMQRGSGVFDRSIAGLKKLNALGYGIKGSGLSLDLVYNPLGAFLPPPQQDLELKYKVWGHNSTLKKYTVVLSRSITRTV